MLVCLEAEISQLYTASGFQYMIDLIPIKRGKNMSIAVARSISEIGQSSITRLFIILQMLHKCYSILSVSKYSAQNTFLFTIIIADNPCTLKALFSDVQALHIILAFLTYVMSFSKIYIQIISSTLQSHLSYFLYSLLLSLSLSLSLFLFLLSSQFSICSSNSQSTRRFLILTTYDMQFLLLCSDLNL